MKNNIVLTLLSIMLLCFVPASNSGAALYTGSITGGDGLTGTDGWSDAVLEWTVDDTTNPGYWTYSYLFNVEMKDISHFILEVSETFTRENLISQSGGYTMDPSAPTWYDGQGNSNPGIPQALFGIKWEDVDALSFSKTIVSDRGPMWGDFYAKDGTDLGEWVYAYNAGFGQDPGDKSLDSDPEGWILVPNTAGSGGEIPIPGGIWLLGSGLIGLAGWRGTIRKTPSDFV